MSRDENYLFSELFNYYQNSYVSIIYNNSLIVWMSRLTIAVIQDKGKMLYVKSTYSEDTFPWQYDHYNIFKTSY